MGDYQRLGNNYHGYNIGGQGAGGHAHKGGDRGYQLRPQLPPQGGNSGKVQQDYHPNIKEMMGPCWQRFGGRVCFDQILQSTGLDIWDMPKMSKHMDGEENNLC